MKKIRIFFISLILFLKPLSLLAYSSDPKSFITELVNEAMSKLSDKTLSDEEKEKFIEQVALNNVDINALGLYTLGELRKSANKKDIEEYQKVFEKYFLKSLTSRFSPPQLTLCLQLLDRLERITSISCSKSII